MAWYAWTGQHGSYLSQQPPNFCPEKKRRNKLDFINTYRISADLKVERDIIASIAASLKGGGNNIRLQSVLNMTVIFARTFVILMLE